MIGSQLHNGVPYHPSVPKKVWRKVRKTIIIDSRDRQMNPGSHAGAYTVTLPAVYQNVYAATLKSIEIPASFYAFSAAANNTTINVTYNGTTRNVTIPDGNYSATLLKEALNTALTSAFGSGNLTAAYDAATSKMTFTGLAQFSLNLTPIEPTSANGGNSLTSNFTTWWGLGYFLGFTGTTYSSAASPGPYVVRGVFAVNPFPSTYILMDLDTMNKIDETSLDDRKSWRVNGAFAKIPMNGNSGTVIFLLSDTGYNPLNRTVYNPPISKLTTLNIKFRLHDGRIIDFNGVEHSFTLELELLDNNFDEFSSLEFSV